MAPASEGGRSPCHSLRRNERGLSDGDGDEGLKARREKARKAKGVKQAACEACEGPTSRVALAAEGSRDRNCPRFTV